MTPAKHTPAPGSFGDQMIKICASVESRNSTKQPDKRSLDVSDKTAKPKFCLATSHPRCSRCAHQRTWLELNQLPDALRLPMQASMQRIDSFRCDDLDGSDFSAAGDKA